MPGPTDAVYGRVYRPDLSSFWGAHITVPLLERTTLFLLFSLSILQKNTWDDAYLWRRPCSLVCSCCASTIGRGLPPAPRRGPGQLPRGREVAVHGSCLAQKRVHYHPNSNQGAPQTRSKNRRYVVYGRTPAKTQCKQRHNRELPEGDGPIQACGAWHSGAGHGRPLLCRGVVRVRSREEEPSQTYAIIFCV